MYQHLMLKDRRTFATVLPIHLTKATLCGLDWVAVLDSFYPGRHISNQISTCMQTGQYNS